jgi:alpha-tubulin suppressor-like RCC1 family protein
MAINNLGLLYSWGLNNVGQLGQVTGIATNGDTISRSSPTQIGTSSWTTVSAGNSFTNAINAIGLAYAWGLGTTGQLGIATNTSRSSPVQVSGGGSWTQIYAANAFSAGIRNNGIAYVWGIGTNSVLGDFTVVAKSSPTILGGGQFINTGTNSPIQVKVGTSFSQVSAGNSFTYAISNTGALWTWGLNSSYQLGLNNDSLNRSSPVQIGSLSWSSVSAGFNHAGAITTTNQLWTFGAVAPINTSSPVQITSGTGSFSQVSAGQSYTLARDINGILYAWGQDTSGQLGYY